MVDESEPTKAISYLSGSPVRVAILERLADGVARPAELVERVDVSRTTVHRTLTDLTERNWAARVDDGYAATPVGELALEIYRTARARFRTLERIESFLTAGDLDVAEFELDWLETARLETATEANPDQPVEWYADRLAATDGDRLRAVTPIITRQFMAVHEPLVAAGTRTELVVDESTFQFVADRYPDRLRESTRLENYDLYVTDRSPSLGLTLVGETVFLGAYDDGRLVVALESTNDRLRAWATQRYERFRTDARRITTDVVSSSR